MEDYEIAEVAKILNEWNPLGDRAARMQDLDGYKTESIDILFYINASNGKAGVDNVVMQVLNEAFDIALTKNECSDATSKISQILSRKH